MTRSLLAIRIATEFDVVQARQRARDIAAMMAVLRTLGHYFIAEVRGPDDLVGGVLDLFAFE